MAEIEWITVSEAARRLETTRKTIYARIADGTLRAYKHPLRTEPGAHHYVSASDVASYVQKLRHLRESRPSYG